MKWLDFLSETLEEKQIEVLKFALKIGANIYLYGSGLGKSTIAYTLSALGYNVSDSGEVSYGHSMYVPDGSDFISFNVKKHHREKYIPNLWNIFLTEQKEEILYWVNL